MFNSPCRVALWLALLSAAGPPNLRAFQLPDAPQPQRDALLPRAPLHSQATPEDLQQLVAPIALYPDSLVSQILAAATFPEQAVEADRWVQAHPGLKGDALGQAVNQQSWDPSVKALTAFPSVLGNLDKNLSWTSSLGDAYYNQPQEVMDAIQAMRQRARQAGSLASTPHQTVATEDSTIVIEPADTNVVYVPAYDPWLVYGNPVDAWPGWYPYPGIWYGGADLSFEAGFGIGWLGDYGWGWHHWGCDWHDRAVVYNNGRYFSRSSTFYYRNNYFRAVEAGYQAERNGIHTEVSGFHSEADGLHADGSAFHTEANGIHAGVNNFNAAGTGFHFEVTGYRNDTYDQTGAAQWPFDGDSRAARGYAEPGGESGIRSDTFSGYSHGGQERSFSTRGGISFSGGFHAGGGASQGSDEHR